jgi:hypothetical protein
MMKMFAVCMQCQAELGHPSFEPFLPDYFDSGVAIIECSKGHKSAILDQSLKFEVLLESGANALLEGFTFEACAAFSAALERFYEFSLHVMFLAHGMSEELFKKVFTEMAKQSERQLGAFVMLYAVEFGEAYKLERKIPEFRNDVIHKGAIPDLEKAKRFCGDVYEVIDACHKKISGKYGEYIQRLVVHEVLAKRRNVPSNMAVVVSIGTMFFSGSRADRPKSFEDALDSFSRARAFIGGVVPEMQKIHDVIRALKK